MPESLVSTTRRIPALDGWRGIAIALVLLDHIQDAYFHLYLRPWTRTGQHGVTIFFVLSGFLITAKLVQGPIDLKRFYLRRLFRLMPAAWAYLAFLVVAQQLWHIHLTSPAEIAACLLFYRNFLGLAGGGFAGHFWSLSLEEQFYLLWPCLLLFAGLRRCRWIAAAGAIACAAYRRLAWSQYDRDMLNHQSQVRADALLAGCLLALLLAEPALRPSILRWSRLLALPAFAAFLFCIATYVWLPSLVECLSIAALVAFTCLNPTALPVRLLSFPPLAWLGVLSYSVYLWQEPFMGFPISWALCTLFPLFVLASYYGIERPCTRLGHRLTRRRIPVLQEQTT